MYLFKGHERADRVAFAAAELAVVFGTFGLVSGSLWGRKAWGVWWQWDAKLTMAFMLEMIFLGYLLVRKYGGPGSEKLAAAMGIFGAATAPFIYKSADWWRTIHPQTSVMKTLGDKAPPMWNVVWFCGAAFVLLFRRAAGAARRPGRAARGARSALSGGRGVKHTSMCGGRGDGAVCCRRRRARASQAQPPPATDGFVAANDLPPTEQLPAAPFVVGAYSCFLVLMVGYVWSIGRRLNTVEKEMRTLEQRQSRGGAAR